MSQVSTSCPGRICFWSAVFVSAKKTASGGELAGRLRSVAASLLADAALRYSVPTFARGEDDEPSRAQLANQSRAHEHRSCPSAAAGSLWKSRVRTPYVRRAEKAVVRSRALAHEPAKHAVAGQNPRQRPADQRRRSGFSPSVAHSVLEAARAVIIVRTTPTLLSCAPRAAFLFLDCDGRLTGRRRRRAVRAKCSIGIRSFRGGEKQQQEVTSHCACRLLCVANASGWW